MSSWPTMFADIVVGDPTGRQKEVEAEVCYNPVLENDKDDMGLPHALEEIEVGNLYMGI